MGGPARPLHEPGNHRSSERCSHRHSADCGSLIEQPTLLRIAAPTPRPGTQSWGYRFVIGNGGFVEASEFVTYGVQFARLFELPEKATNDVPMLQQLPERYRPLF